jgi:hypothetical protein
MINSAILNVFWFTYEQSCMEFFFSCWSPTCLTLQNRNVLYWSLAYQNVCIWDIITIHVITWFWRVGYVIITNTEQLQLKFCARAYDKYLSYPNISDAVTSERCDNQFQSHAPPCSFFRLSHLWQRDYESFEKKKSTKNFNILRSSSPNTTMLQL